MSDRCLSCEEGHKLLRDLEAQRDALIRERDRTRYVLDRIVNVGVSEAQSAVLLELMVEALTGVPVSPPKED